MSFVRWADAARFANWLHNGQPTGAQDTSTTEDGTYDLTGTHSCYGAGGTILDHDGLVAALNAVTREADATWAVPTEDEWYKAAYHKNNGATGDYYTYPTASNTQPSGQLVTPDGGNDANYWDGGDTIGGAYYRTEVGEFELSASPYGTFDQGGNVNEWNESVIWDGDGRGWRGVAFGSSGFGEELFLRASTRGGEFPLYRDSWIGFRVADVPEPATFALLALGGVVMLRKRRSLGG